MTHEIVKLPRPRRTATFQHAQLRPWHGGRVAGAVVLAAIVALLGVLARPNPPPLSTVVTGDAALAAWARPLLPGALDRVSIAVVDGATTTYAHFGANEYTEYEIGSLTKTFTGDREVGMG
jgi:CubicO group peptidase (beta-lactamase class C family)